ncbi:MAG: PhoU domain-containing protein [Acidobacteriota bacterium]|nr:PhoU domain-containing protein [Acidobacteriota bacterium]
MSHYAERLEKDLEHLRQQVQEVGKAVLEAQRNAVQAVLREDRELAYETIIGDHPINRQVHAIDQACHAFVARHLPSAGHLRFVSSVLRLNVALERIGDYAATMCRQAVQLSAPPPERVAQDLDLMGEQSRNLLEQALEAWNEGNAELARGTIGMARQAASASEKVFADLLREGDKDRRPVHDLFGLLIIFNRLDRVVGQAKNICEETLFAVAGETKAAKVYRFLFVDEADDALTHIAAAYGRKAFPESGIYATAGWRPAKQVRPELQDFLQKRGLDDEGFEPRELASLGDELSDYHVLISLGGDPRAHLPELPFHTVILEWPMDKLPAGAGEAEIEGALHTLGHRLGDLMETLHGPGAG